jgi:hypothetical protein
MDLVSKATLERLLKSDLGAVVTKGSSIVERNLTMAREDRIESSHFERQRIHRCPPATEKLAAYPDELLIPGLEARLECGGVQPSL